MYVKHIIAMILAGGVLFFMFSCREYRMYKYNPVELSLNGGDLVVVLEGTYGKNREVEGKKIAEFTYPYHLQFFVSVPYEKSFNGLLVKDVELVGLNSSRHYQLGEKKASKVNDPRARSNPRAKARTAIVIFGPMLADDYEYENFSLRAKIVIYGERGRVLEESISILIDTNFEKKKRSDWFDGIMSA